MPSRPRFLENLALRADPVTTPHKHPSLSGDGSEMKGGEAPVPHRHMDCGGSVGNQKEGRLFQPRFPISILHLYLCGFERGEDALEVHTQRVRSWEQTRVRSSRPGRPKRKLRFRFRLGSRRRLRR